MSEYNEILKVLSIEENILEEGIKELLRNIPERKSCNLCMLSKIIHRQNTDIDVSELRLDFPEMKNSFECYACSKFVSIRCHRFTDSQNKHLALVQQLINEATIELQTIQEKIRLMADRKEMYEDELHKR